MVYSFSFSLFHNDVICFRSESGGVVTVSCVPDAGTLAFSALAAHLEIEGNTVACFTISLAILVKIFLLVAMLKMVDWNDSLIQFTIV